MNNDSGGTIAIQQTDSPLSGLKVVVPPGALGTGVTVRVSLQPLKDSPPTSFGQIAQGSPNLLAQMGTRTSALTAQSKDIVYHPLWHPFFLALSPVNSIGQPFQIEPSGHRFAKPVEVTVPFTLLGVQNIDADSLFPMKGSAGPDGSIRWELVTDFRVDPAASTVTMKVTEFSTFDFFVAQLAKWAPLVRQTAKEHKVELGFWGNTVLNNAEENVRLSYLKGSPAALVEETKKNFPNQDTLNPFPSIAKTIGCTGVAPSARQPSIPLPSLLVHLTGFKLPKTVVDLTGIKPLPKVATPAEKALQNWLIFDVNPDKTGKVTAAGIFAKAYELNKGDTFAALLTTHNVLRANFRNEWALDFPSHPELVNKIAPLRGDGKDEDGALYHFFGMATYGYAQAYYQNAAFLEGNLAQFALLRSLTPEMAADVEEKLISTNKTTGRPLPDFWVDPREYVVDLAGGQLGTDLFNRIQGRDLGDLKGRYPATPAECANLAAIPPPKPPPPATLTVNPASGVAGSLAVVTGQGFTPASRVTVTVAGVAVASPVPDANGSFTVRITVPAQLGPGPKGVTAKDSSGRTANAPFTVTAPPPKPADLTVLPVSFSPRAGIPGDSIAVSFTVKNQGEAPSGPFSNRISLATTRYGTNISLGNFSMGSLAGGVSQPSTVRVTIPESVTPGTYWVTVFTDGFQAISEGDENNNIGSSDSAQINIFPATPATLTVSPSAGAADAVVTVTGQSFTPNSQVLLTFGGVTVASPVTQADGTFTVQVTVPAQLGPGAKEVRARDSIGQSANTTFTVGGSGVPAPAPTPVGGAAPPPAPAVPPSSACNNPYENTSWDGTLNLSFYGEATYSTTIQFTFGPARSGDCETVPVASGQVSDSSRTWRLDTNASSIGCAYHRSAPQGTGAYARCETIEFNLKFRLVSGPSGVGRFTIDPLSIRIQGRGSNVLSTTQIKGPGGAGCCEWGTFSATRR